MSGRAYAQETVLALQALAVEFRYLIPRPEHQAAGPGRCVHSPDSGTNSAA